VSYGQSVKQYTLSFRSYLPWVQNRAQIFFHKKITDVAMFINSTSRLHKSLIVDQAHTVLVRPSTSQKKQSTLESFITTLTCSKPIFYLSFSSFLGERLTIHFLNLNMNQPPSYSLLHVGAQIATLVMSLGKVITVTNPSI